MVPDPLKVKAMRPKRGLGPGEVCSREVFALAEQRFPELAGERVIEGRVSGHSLRVGGAQSLAAAGASVVEMQTADRWQSPSMPDARSLCQGPARGSRRGRQAPLRGVETPMGGALQQSRIVFPVIALH